MMNILGIDTLEFGIYIENYDTDFSNFIIELDRLKTLSQQNFNNEIIEINNSSFEVSPKGLNFYRYKIQNKEVIICFSHKSISNTPDIYVKFSSLFLWEYGYMDSYKIFLEWFKYFNVKIKDIQISRLDICLDTDMVSFSEKDSKYIFTRARKLDKKYVDDIYFNGKIFSGFVVGRGSALSCRIYNKSLEIKNSNKQWFEEIWKQSGHKENTTVWRVEFQIRKKVLKELSIYTINDINNNLNNIWSYMTEKWLIMRSSNNDTNKSRWKTSKKWKIIQKANFIINGNENIRHREVKGEIDKLVSQCGGILISISALSNRTLNNAYLHVVEYLKNMCSKNNTTIEDKIYKRKNKYIKNKS